MSALSRIVCRQCGQVRVAPGAPARTGVMPARPFEPRSYLCLFPPAELDLAAHPGTGRHGQRVRAQVAVENPGREQLHARGPVDVAVDLTADRYGARTHPAGERRARIDREVALHVYVALEASRDSHVAGALDLALDRELRGDDRFLAGAIGGAERRARGRHGLDVRFELLSRRYLSRYVRRRFRRGTLFLPNSHDVRLHTGI